MLATHSLLPIVRAFTESAGVNCELRDISLAGSAGQLPTDLDSSQRVDDELSKLGELCKTPAANVIKLPNISASIPQLGRRVLQSCAGKGFDVPPFSTSSEEIQKRYAKVLGSAVDPVLREGNSDRAPSSRPRKRICQGEPVRRRVPLWCLHAIDATRGHLTMKWGGFFFDLEAIRPSRDT